MGANILLTGGSGGIGLEMAKTLAGDAQRLIITGRDPGKLAAAADEINARAGTDTVAGQPLDLGDFDAVNAFAEDIAGHMPRIDVLILNAGLYTRRLHHLANGFEAMIGTMHLGHFLLTQRLLTPLLAAETPRVVVTSSVAHKTGRIDFDSFTDPSRHRIGFAGYAQAKLANLLFTRELARRYGDRGLHANAFHPGAVATGIWRELPPPLPWLADKLMISPAQGADTGAWLARAPEAEHYNGEYFVKRRVAKASAAARDAELAQQLWAESERCCGLS